VSVQHEPTGHGKVQPEARALSCALRKGKRCTCVDRLCPVACNAHPEGYTCISLQLLHCSGQRRHRNIVQRVYINDRVPAASLCRLMVKAVYEHDDVLIDIVEREWGLRCHAIVTTENESVVRPDDCQTNIAGHLVCGK